MRVRQVLVTCLVGAVGVIAVPSGAMALPSAEGAVAARVPASPNYSSAVLAPALQQLRAEVNARWPARSRASDGWLGDTHHQRSKSEHNPVGHPNGPVYGTPGSVHALDITAGGVDTGLIISALLRDSRVWYVIHNRTIWSRSYGFAARPYHGDGHTTHIHVSLRAEDQGRAVAVENDTRPWLPAAAAPASLSADSVRALQQALIARGFSIPAGPTGIYGPQTRGAVAAFQRAQGWSGSGADGLAGAETLRRLGVVASAPTVTFAFASSQSVPPPSRPATPSGATGGSYAPGASGPHVAGLQRALIARGFGIANGATGFFGSQTQGAVAAFQRAQGWSGPQADGIPGPVTLARLGISGSAAAPAAAAAPAPVAAPATPAASGRYAPGASGEHIKWLQRALLKNGIPIPSGVTGWFGPETQGAVAAFQRAQGWSGPQADGIPGPVTQRRLGLA